MEKETRKDWVKLIIIISVACISSLALWEIIAIQEIEKFPEDFEFFMEHSGTDQIAPDVNSELSTPYLLMETLHQKVTDNEGDTLTISSRVFSKNPFTGEVVFDLTKEYQIDRTTLEHIDLDGKLFGFKPGVEKRDYDFLHPLVFGEAKLVYLGTEIIQGLETFVFKAEIKNHDVSTAFPQFSPHTIISDTVSTLWIEPRTGDLLRFEKHWLDYTIEDGVQKNIVQDGWKKTTEYSEFTIAQATKSKIGLIETYNFLIPILILSSHIGVGSILLLRRKLKLQEHEMKKQEKLATIGHISARVAHDLRNPLSVIKNVIYLNEMSPPKTREEAEKRQQMAIRAIERMTHQVNRVMDFVKTKPLKIENIPIKKIFDSVQNSIMIPKEIKLVYEGDKPTISCDPNLLEVVLANLIVNAIHAMDGKGIINFRVENKKNHISIKVIDQGTGIPEENMAKIFEPLFTTKQKGTGLGLSSCKNIVEQHGGMITVNNNPTTFTITLPKFIPIEMEKNV